SYQFLEKVRDNYMFQHVKSATRYRAGEIDSILDLIFTNEENMVDNIEYLPPLGKSDHLTLVFRLKLYIDKPKCTEKRYNFFKGKYEKVNENLRRVEWEEVTGEDSSTNEAWGGLADIIETEINENIPVCKTSDRKYDTPWITKTAVDAVRNKRRKWIKYINQKSEENKEIYNSARNRASIEIRKAKVCYEKQLAENIKNDEKCFWRYVKSKTKTKDVVGNLEGENGNLVTESSERAEILNQFFTSVFTNENIVNIPEFEDRNFESPLTDIETSEEEVRKLITKLKPGKSQGPDQINPKFLIETAETLLEPITKIFKKSLSDGEVPDIWKSANITALYKKGPKTKAENYRPISLTSVICKTLEKIVRDRIMKHMEDNNLFTKHQHGFRKGHSCATQLIEVCDKWTEELDKKNSVDVIFLDFQKAFDSVPYKRLFEKLKGYGIRGNVLKWIQSILDNRKQRVSLNGEYSKWSNVTSGIPQGSVIGPTLFLIYINDLPEVVQNTVKMFADDTKIFARVNNMHESNVLQNDINSLTTWSEKWQLKFNASKCKHMHIGKETNLPEYTMIQSGTEIKIEEVQEEKDLGVILDNKLKFTSHIQASVKKANRNLGIIKRTFKYMDKVMFLNLYKSLIRPHLEYASTVWSVIYKKECILIENVQRRATKLIKNMENKIYSDRLKMLGIPSLQYRRTRSDMVEVFKILNGIDKADKDQLFQMNNENRIRGHNWKLKKKQFRLDVRKQTFSQRVINVWNGLPENVVSADSLNIFKGRLNDHWKNIPIKFQPDCYTATQTGRVLNYEDGTERQNDV
ncbi:MAG: reverse transcriptase family protein, partial [Sedimenticola sp.]